MRAGILVGAPIMNFCQDRQQKSRTQCVEARGVKGYRVKQLRRRETETMIESVENMDLGGKGAYKRGVTALVGAQNSAPCAIGARTRSLC